ncbi:MAG: type II toxin-antitoxin system HicB family antitoxin [Planctomycetota bacterium]|nr:type II toxin-antitoxin system HicB family antitoxin [Planctomycetota bacterium]
MKLCVRIIRSEQGEYVAMCPSLPGCTSRGWTQEEAAGRLDEAIRGYVAAVNNFVPDQVEHQVVEA